MNRIELSFERMTANEKSLFVQNLRKDVVADSKFGICPLVNFEFLGDESISVVLTPESKECKEEWGGALEFIARKLFSGPDFTRKFLFRGVKLERLESVVTSGCDVTPTTASIFASDSAKKALEYGEVVMVFDATKLKKTFVEVPKSESAENLNRLRSEYPTEVENGESLWFSKLPSEDFRVGTSYEWCYSFYIPGDPWEALLMIFLVGDDKNLLLSEFSRRTNKPLPPQLQAELNEWEQKQAKIRSKQAEILEKFRRKRDLIHSKTESHD